MVRHDLRLEPAALPMVSGQAGVRPGLALAPLPGRFALFATWRKAPGGPALIACRSMSIGNLGLGKLILAASVVGGGVHAWHVHEHNVAVRKLQASGDTYGFVPVMASSGAPQNTAIILAALNCPSAQAKRADALAAKLDELGIPNTRANNYSVANVTRDQASMIEQTSAVLGGEIPVVIINGRGKANPSVDDVVAEFRHSL
jgi:hypothetical protein